MLHCGAGGGDPAAAGAGGRCVIAYEKEPAFHYGGLALCVSEAAFARRKRRKAAGGKIVDFPPGPPAPFLRQVKRLQSLAAPVAEDCFEFPPAGGSNPSQSRRTPSSEALVQPLELSAVYDRS